MMASDTYSRSSRFDVKKFCARMKPHQAELERQLKDSITALKPDYTPSKTDWMQMEARNVSKDQLYGLVTRDEFQDIIDSYDKQQTTKDKCDAPVANKKGVNFNQLLHSKPGFHHPGSTSYLVGELDIVDIDRYSLLGGFSTYKPGEGERLNDLKTAQKNSMTYEFVDRAHHKISTSQWQDAFNDIEIAMKMNPECGDAIAARARYYIQSKNYDKAIRDLRYAADKTIKYREFYNNTMAEALFQTGMRQYYHRNFSQARKLFSEALNYDSHHANATIHRNLCDKELNRGWSAVKSYRG